MRINLPSAADASRVARATMWVMDMEPPLTGEYVCDGPADGDESLWKFHTSDREYTELRQCPVRPGDVLEFAEPWADFGIGEEPIWAIRLRRTVTTITAKRLKQIGLTEAMQAGFESSGGCAGGADTKFREWWTASGRAWQPESWVWCVGMNETVDPHRASRQLERHLDVGMKGAE